MLWVLKRTVSMRRFFWAPKTYAKYHGYENIYNFTLKFFVYLNLWYDQEMPQSYTVDQPTALWLNSSMSWEYGTFIVNYFEIIFSVKGSRLCHKYATLLWPSIHNVTEYVNH